MGSAPWLADRETSSSPFLYAPPRLRVAQGYEMTHGARAEQFALQAGIEPVRWQLDVLNDWGAVDGDMQFVHRRCGASIPRQAGKSTDAIVWVAYLACVLGMAVLYTAHNYSTTCEMLRRFRKMLGKKANDPTAERPQLNRLVRSCENKTAQEAFFLKNGGRIHFSTRTKSSALGFSFDVIVYDEAQELTTEQSQAIDATMSSGPAHNPQQVYVGTPHRPGSFGNVFGPMRGEAHDAPEDDLCWWEWGAGEVGDVADESRWFEVNPSLGLGVADIEAIRLNCRKYAKLGDEGELAFAQEFMGYWLPGNRSEPPAIDADTWDALACDEPPAEGRLFAAFKFAPDGSRVAVACCRKPEGAPAHVECLGVFSMSGGLSRHVQWALDRQRRYCGFVVDGGGNAREMCDRLAAARMPRRAVVQPAAAQVCAACAGLLADVADGGFTHFAQPGLDASAKSCRKRPIGRTGFGFEGMDGADALPLEACALALWGAGEIKRDPARKMRIG